MIQRLGLFILALIIIIPFASATFSSVFTPIENEILPNGTATFELTISNFGSSEHRFQVSTIDPRWIMGVDPLSMTVPEGSSETFTVSLKPKSSVSFGSHGVALTIRDLESGSTSRQNVFVALKRYGEIQGQYSPSVAFNIGLPQEIDPREPVPFDVSIRNRNPLDIDDMTLSLSSPHYEYATRLPLEPLAEQSQNLVMRLDSQQAPGDYVMRGELRYRNTSIASVTRTYAIGSYADVQEEEEEYSFLLRSEQATTLENDGNVAREVTLTQPANILQRPFTGSSHDREYENGQYHWTITVAPGETITVTHTQNYRWIVLAIILAILATIAYYLFRSPVVALKEAVGVESDEGVSDLKLRVFVKNRSNQVIQGVEVFDKVPRIADIKEDHVEGTIKPSKISRLKSGTMIRWDLDILEPFEERILTYTVQSKLRIVGKIRMPQAKIKFETSKGQERVVYSNNILVVEKNNKA